ncbi:YgaP family membrane protein [Algoriphagus formosus]|jgi:Na+/phosphate symporter|uniref:DUF2892 domain-containing protein n=1 Tax=Algoriphagus formosus TaxID=2007308 RepID=A0A4R5UZW4_9BACT|nr:MULTISPECIES: DUF2892 domain-containing protein [Algoriphagus]TDK44944.1 DUF2892 domain-containing protein [Algoriphagus aquimaris]
MRILEKNMGLLDIGIRIILAAVLFTLFFTNTVTGTIGFIDLGIAILFTVTSFVGFCPLYKVFGFKTCPNKRLK